MQSVNVIKPTTTLPTLSYMHGGCQPQTALALQEYAFNLARHAQHHAIK
ncbi:MAG: hypothetical protein GY919_04625 [Photobacterium aquimaris]|nr:hypothetical protein [Photobacterium aquimaris]